MATQATRQVITASIDTPGLSISSATRSPLAPRAGSIYDTTKLAAAAPVWFHSTYGGNYIAIFSSRLTDAVLAPQLPGLPMLYRAAIEPVDPEAEPLTVESTDPCWAVINSATGATRDVGVLPTRKRGTRTLAAATSRGDYLFTLNRYQASPTAEPQVLLQHFRISRNQGVTLMVEEFVPRNLGLGLWADRSHIWVFGDDGTGLLTMARKNWGRIGTNRDTNPSWGWQFHSRRGWDPKPTQLTPLVGDIPADGPCSMAHYRDQFYLSSTTKTTYPATVPAVLGTPDVDQTPVEQIQDLLDGIFGQIRSLLNGVINGFFGLTTGVVSMFANLFDQAISVITGQPGTVNETVTALVRQFLDALTGAVDVITDPAALLADIFSAISDIPIVGPVLEQVITTAQSFLEGTINTILGLFTQVTGIDPVQLLEDIIRAITGILTGIGFPGIDPFPEDVVTTYLNPDASLIPSPSWRADVYASRRVEEAWTKHSFDYDLAPTTMLYRGGMYLQEQVPMTAGFGSTVTYAGVTILDEFSDQIQVFTGTSPQTVILPPIAKVTGTKVITGAVEVPVTPEVVLPKLSVGDASILEGTRGIPVTLKFRVSLSAQYDKAVTVKYATATETATQGGDYVAATGTLTFPPGIISQQSTVNIIGDLAFEEDETFTVILTDPVNAVLDDDEAVCTILNDDRETLIESLLNDFQNIVNGVISGAIRVGTAVVTAVATILEQSARTLTGVVGQTGELVYSAVDQFLNLISGGLIDLPGDVGTPAENLAQIMSLITGGVEGISEAITTLAGELFSAITDTATVVITNTVDIFQRLVGSFFGFFGGTFSVMSAQAMLMATTTVPTTSVVVTYMPYTIHNQSTADIVVMASDRDKTIPVPHGSGLVFTPYIAEPTDSTHWSWSYAPTRTPRHREGFPIVATRKLAVNTYRITITGSPEAGLFRFVHDGYLTGGIGYSPTTSATTAENITTALKLLKSMGTVAVEAISTDEFVVAITGDCGKLDLYDYKFVNGTDPEVTVETDESLITLDSRWSGFVPQIKLADPTGPAKVAAANPDTPAPTTPAELPDLISQFASVIAIVSNNVLAVGTGVVTTVTGILTQAVYLVSGKEISDTDGAVTGAVTDFLQKLARDPGVTPDAATSFENILRKITGGTGTTVDVPDLPTPQDFISAAIDAVEDAIETLAEWLQKLINAITGN